MNRIDDEALVILIKRLSARRDDEVAWRLLYDSLWPYVFSIIYRKVSSQKELAEDLSQEVFLRILRYVDFTKLQKPASFRSYVARIARNQVADYLTSKDSAGQSSQALPLTEAEMITEDESEKHLEFEDLLDRILQPLSSGERNLAHMLAADLSLDEIADLLNVSYSAAATRVHRLRAKLKDHPVFAEFEGGREKA